MNTNKINKVVLCALCVNLCGVGVVAGSSSYSPSTTSTVRPATTVPTTSTVRTSTVTSPTSTVRSATSPTSTVRTSTATSPTSTVRSTSPTSIALGGSASALATHPGTALPVTPEPTRLEKAADFFGEMGARIATSDTAANIAGGWVNLGNSVGMQAVGAQLSGASVKNSLTTIGTKIKTAIARFSGALPTQDTIDTAKRTTNGIQSDLHDISGKIHTAIYPNGAAGVQEAEAMAEKNAAALEELTNIEIILESKWAAAQQEANNDLNQLLAQMDDLKTFIRNADMYDLRTLNNKKDDASDIRTNLLIQRPGIRTDANKALANAFANFETLIRKLDQSIGAKQAQTYAPAPVAAQVATVPAPAPVAAQVATVPAPAPVAPAADAIASLITNEQANVKYFEDNFSPTELELIQEALDDFTTNAANANAANNPIVKSIMKKYQALIAKATV